MADAVWVVLVDLDAAAGADDADVFVECSCVVGAVADFVCAASPVELWRALAAGIQTLIASSAQIAPNRAFLILFKSLTIQPDHKSRKSTAPKSPQIQKAQRTLAL